MKWVLLSAITVAVLGLLFIRRGTNNVCKTFKDYYSNRDNNENCYYNPDHELEVPDIIKRHGYPVETHKVTTEDGYILTVFRIPHRGDQNDKKPRKPIFIQHGLAINSGAFVNIGKKSLGFILVDAGFDVWLGNFRGTLYSRNHTVLNNEESKFWDFSFHEHGVYDLPAQLNHVSEVTKQKIIYIGLSMGTTSSFIYGTSYPDEAYEKVDIFISLAPVAFMKDLWFLKHLIYPWLIVQPLVQALGNGKLVPRPFLPPWLFTLVCLPFPVQMEMCQIPDMLFFGFDYEQNDPETLPVTLQHNRDATSTKVIDHFAQLMVSGNFQKFDYGEEGNKKVYGTSDAPHYELSRMKVPNYFIRAENDLATTNENIEKLHKSLPKSASPYDIYVVQNERFNHISFFTGKDAPLLVYNHIVDFIKGNR